MLIYAYDKSKGESFKKNRRRLSSLLFRVSNRSFIGDLPYWVIKDLILDIKKDATKSSNIAIFVESKRKNGPGHMGWKCFFVGKKPSDGKLTPFIEAKSFIDLSI